MGHAEVAVVGGGPAGMAAALAAERAGARVAIVDESPFVGGQIYRQLMQPLRAERFLAEREHVRAEAMFRALASSSIEILTGRLAWGVDGNKTLALYREGGSVEMLRAQALVVAAGAYDRPIAFPGWTLPGVWTVGAAQAMLKSQRILAGHRVLLAGTGPLLLPAATALTDAGARVLGIVEATTRREWMRQAHRMLPHWTRIRDMIRYETALLRAQVPRFFGHIVIRAEGRNTVERITIAAVDRQWRPQSGTEQTFEADLLCLGYGFLSNMELPRLLGCEMTYDPVQEQHCPKHNDEMETTVPGVFVAGETTGIGGAELALAEGEVAGLAAAAAVGHKLTDQRKNEMRHAEARRRHQVKFVRVLDALFAPRPGIYELAEPATPLCRCEEVTAEEVRTAVRRGATSLRAVKGQTRVGMGWCQGRICGQLVARVVAHEAGCPLENALDVTPRPPIKPIPLHILAGLAQT